MVNDHLFGFSFHLIIYLWFFVYNLLISFHSMLLWRVSFNQPVIRDPAWSPTGDSEQSAGFQHTSATHTTVVLWKESGSAHQPLTAGNSRFNRHGDGSLCLCDLHYAHFPSAVKGGQMFCVRWDICYTRRRTKKKKYI